MTWDYEAEKKKLYKSIVKAFNADMRALAVADRSRRLTHIKKAVGKKYGVSQRTVYRALAPQP